MALTFRDNNASPLSYTEMDSNFRYFTGSFENSGSITASAFVGDGSALTGVTAEWDGTHVGNAQITGSLILSGSGGTNLNVIGQITSSGNISASGVLYANTAYFPDRVITPLLRNPSSISIYSDSGDITLSGNKVIASGNVSSSAVSTASFGTYLGDGSQLTGISTGSTFPFAGDAQISGSLLIANQADPDDRYFRAYGQSGDYSIYIDEQRQVSGRAQLYVGANDKGFTDGNPVVSGYNNISSSMSLYTDRGIYANGDIYGSNGVFNTNVSASGDIIVGYNSANPITITGYSNASVSIGDDSYLTPTAGLRYNVAIGRNSLKAATTGQKNVAVGDSALQSSQGQSYNCAIGFGSTNGLGTSGGTGQYNAVMGYQSLFYPHSATGNVAIGYRAMFGSTSTNETLQYNTVIGYEAGEGLYSGSNNVMIGYQCIDNSNYKNSNNTYVGSSCVPSATSGIENENVFGYATTGIGTNTVALGNTSVTAIKGQVATSTYSDSRIKRNIQSGSLGLDFINTLNPVRFQRVNPAEYPEEIIERRYTERTKWDPETSSSIIIPADPAPPTDNSWVDGLIAQEVSASLNGIPSDIWNENEMDGKQGIKYSVLTVPLIKAIQELSAKITSLEAQISGSV